MSLNIFTWRQHLIEILLNFTPDLKRLYDWITHRKQGLCNDGNVLALHECTCAPGRWLKLPGDARVTNKILWNPNSEEEEAKMPERNDNRTDNRKWMLLRYSTNTSFASQDHCHVLNYVLRKVKFNSLAALTTAPSPKNQLLSKYILIWSVSSAKLGIRQKCCYRP